MLTDNQPFKIQAICGSKGWTFEQRLKWVQHWAHIYHNSTTREERIAHYRLKQGENVKHYDTYGWPENF